MIEAKSFTEEEFQSLLTEQKLNWSIRENGVEKSMVFNDFISAFQFMGKIAVIAEGQNHHPEWTNIYNKDSFASRHMMQTDLRKMI